MYFEEPEGFYTDDFMAYVMGIDELPKMLFQYTSIDSLEKILSSKTLRFSRLDRVNDPEEAMASDVPLAATSVFVSCWSSTEEEQIPMWSMYGDSFSGVRIRLPADMFSGRNKSRVYEKGGALTWFDGDYSIMRKFPAMGVSGCAIIGPNKVYYTDDASYHTRRLVYRSDGMANFYPYDLGMAKKKCWEYEQEWRFKIATHSFESQVPDDIYFNEVTIDFEKYPVITEDLFIPLDESAFDEMEITIGPKANREMILRIERIIAQYAPKSFVVPSVLRIR